MSRSFKSYKKREPKNKAAFKGAGFNAWCGWTCCGFRYSPGHQSAKAEIRYWRRKKDREALREGLREVREENE